MADPWLDEPKFKFVAGRGDLQHEMRLAEAKEKGYRAKFMVCDPNGIANNLEYVVLMEKD
jgi:hypothetical protein